jgi:hypothetical protein
MAEPEFITRDQYRQDLASLAQVEVRLMRWMLLAAAGRRSRWRRRRAGGGRGAAVYRHGRELTDA